MYSHQIGPNDVEPVRIVSADADFLELQRWDQEYLAKLFGLPPALVRGDTYHAANELLILHGDPGAPEAKPVGILKARCPNPPDKRILARSLHWDGEFWKPVKTWFFWPWPTSSETSLGRPQIAEALKPICDGVAMQKYVDSLMSNAEPD